MRLLNPPVPLKGRLRSFRLINCKISYSNVCLAGDFINRFSEYDLYIAEIFTYTYKEVNAG